MFNYYGHMQAFFKWKVELEIFIEKYRLELVFETRLHKTLTWPVANPHLYISWI